jgi:hypothetical protein
LIEFQPAAAERDNKFGATKSSKQGDSQHQISISGMQGTAA